MKRFFLLVLSFGVAGFWPAAHVLAASPANLLAPAYTNSKQIKSGPYSATFFTNDSAASVCGFYKRNGIKFDESGKGGCSVQLLDSVAICHAQDRAHSQAPTDPSKAPRGVSNPPPETAGITVTAGETPPAVTSNVMIPDEKDSVFPYLKQEVVKQQVSKQNKHTASQLLALYNKYRWLDTAFYPLHKAAKGVEPYNHWLVTTTAARVGHATKVVGGQAVNVAQNEAAVAARVRELMAEGKTQEAMALAKKMRPGMETGAAAGQFMTKEQEKDRWNTWVKVLKKLAAHAYRTKIEISKKPAVWPMRLFPPHSSCLG